TMQVGVWAPTQRISKRNSTGNASWGVGPNTENENALVTSFFQF
ncbi:hypothetical protein V331_01717, partial [Staphylococcus aureus F85660]